MLPTEILNHCQQYTGCDGCPVKEACHTGKRLVGLGYTNQQYLESMVEVIKGVNKDD